MQLHRCAESEESVLYLLTSWEYKKWKGAKYLLYWSWWGKWPKLVKFVADNCLWKGNFFFANAPSVLQMLINDDQVRHHRLSLMSQHLYLIRPQFCDICPSFLLHHLSNKLSDIKTWPLCKEHGTIATSLHRDFLFLIWDHRPMQSIDICRQLYYV